MESVNECSAATDDVVRCQAHFTFIMAQRMNGNSDFNKDMPELTKVMATASLRFRSRS
jgi:hypothetical protein